MRSRATMSIVIALLSVLGAARCLPAQQKQADSPSHRFIPSGTKPTMDAFKTPEFHKALEEYRSLRHRKSSKPVSVPTFDPSLIETLSPETQELLREWSRESMKKIAAEIKNDIASFNEQRSKNNGLPKSEGPQDLVPFDFTRDVLERFENVRKTYFDQRRLRNSQYDEALRKFRERWPSEKIPPEQWLRQVQPFINSEVMEQLKDARDFQDGKTSEPPQPIRIPTTKPARGFSSRMIESVVKTLDSGSTKLIRRAQRNNRGEMKTPWWKRLKSLTNSKIKSINKSITDRTEAYAATATTATTATSSSTLPAGGGSNVSIPHLTRQAPGRNAVNLAAAAIIVLGSMYLFLRWKRSANHTVRCVRTMDAAMICDRESILLAINNVAENCFGRSSRFWHHHQLFARFQQHAGIQHDPIIGQLYEKARYAPEGSEISSEELNSARRWHEVARGAGRWQR